MDTFSAYDCRLASGERASVLIVHGHGSVDMGAELAELLGAGFRNVDTARVELPAVETAVADGRGGLVWSASHGAVDWLDGPQEMTEAALKATMDCALADRGARNVGAGLCPHGSTFVDECERCAAEAS